MVLQNLFVPIMQKNGLSRIDPPLLKMLWRMGKGSYDLFEHLIKDIISNPQAFKF